MTNIVLEKKRNFNLKEFISFTILALIIVLPIRLFVAQPFIVNGTSMSPTFETGQYLIVDQVSYAFREIQRGDVIIFNFPQYKSKFFIKRIIGLPGETVDINLNEVYISSESSEPELLNESYVEFKKTDSLTITLEEDEYFVMGDNRKTSLDSRIWGPIKKEYIVGRAFLRLLPLAEIDYLPGSINS